MVDKALALVPEYPLALFYKTSMLLEMGQPELALPLLETLAEIDSPYVAWANYVLESYTEEQEDQQTRGTITPE